MRSNWRALLNPVRSEQGFTLLEVIIALSIMVLSFASILAVESNSINATIRAKEMNIVAMLARNQMVELEYKIEGKTFEEVRKEEGGSFDPPYESYRWKSEIKEIKFPNLNPGGEKKEGEEGGNQYAELITKLVAKFFSKAIREISVTVFWKRGSSDQSFSVSTYWVDLNHEFETTE